MANLTQTLTSGAPLRRVEAYSDGVFAIAATLLALGVGTDAIGSVTTDQDLWAGLTAQSTAFLGIVIAFLVLCNMWAIQARQIGSLTLVSSRLLVFNALRLLGVIFVPFVTSVATHYDDLTIGRLLMPLDIFWIVLFGVLTGWHARSAGLVGEERTDRPGVRTDLFTIGLAAAVVVLAPFVGLWAFALFALEAPLLRLFRLPRR
ncbi:TMEM175 family protein [Cellulomonas sp. McL0617]|uniref:TMEM175 family protein n=1 Tax=Cellulomonas sp. McL0617 TaxID=3415675 RepID=UPI003CF26BCF